MKARIKIFSTTTCPYCKMLKSYLTDHGISYEEALVDKDHQALHEMEEESDGFTGVPFTIITKENGEKIKIEGFDRQQVDQALGLS